MLKPMYFKFQNLITPQATAQTRSILTHECTTRLAPGHKFTPSVKKKKKKCKCIISDLWHWIPSALCTVYHLVLPVRPLCKPVTPHPHSLILCASRVSRSYACHCSRTTARSWFTRTEPLHRLLSWTRALSHFGDYSRKFFFFFFFGAKELPERFPKKRLAPPSEVQWDLIGSPPHPPPPTALILKVKHRRANIIQPLKPQWMIDGRSGLFNAAAIPKRPSTCSTFFFLYLRLF